MEIVEQRKLQAKYCDKEYDIADMSVLHDIIICENVVLMLISNAIHILRVFVSDNQHWIERGGAQLSTKSHPPFYLDLHNIASYHYLKLQQDELLQQECCCKGNSCCSSNSNTTVVVVVIVVVVAVVVMITFYLHINPSSH
uniref:Uncharacterized protein n=1 Tax=Penaeus monodon majanivirus B TaxID=2984272 RepID=A0A9C7F7J9_9VIRU|nr:MAG: hypothetical protein [Penaeus monodon majanivirus B]